jgi:hypothetical protein
MMTAHLNIRFRCFTGQPFDPLPPSIFGPPDKSGNEIEDMFARWIKSYGR